MTHAWVHTSSLLLHPASIDCCWEIAAGDVIDIFLIKCLFLFWFIEKVNSTFHFIPRLNVIKVLSHDTPPLPFHSVASREDNECNYSGVNGAHLFSEEKISSAELVGKFSSPQRRGHSRRQLFCWPTPQTRHRAHRRDCDYHNSRLWFIKGGENLIARM